MQMLVRRRFTFAPPPWRVFDALVAELDAWWLARDDETVPEVIGHERPHRVTYRSPFVERPDDTIAMLIEPSAQGTEVVVMQHSPLEGAEVVRDEVRHRWGHHLGGEFRDWLDHGTPLTPGDFVVTYCRRPGCPKPTPR